MTAKSEMSQEELIAAAMPAPHPYVETLQVPLPVTAAAKASWEGIVGVVPFAGTVTGVTYTPTVEEAESGTEYRKFKVEDLASGNVLAEFSTKAAKIKAGTQQALTLNATAADLVVAAGDILKFKDTSTEGKETKGGLLTITIARQAAQAPSSTLAGETAGDLV